MNACILSNYIMNLNKLSTKEFDCMGWYYGLVLTFFDEHFLKIYVIWHKILMWGQGFSKSIPFSQFLTTLGCHILTAQTDRELVIAKIWHTYHVPHTTIAKFWHQLWKQEEARQITMFQWLLIHRLLSVGAWHGGILSSPNAI